MSEPKLRFKEFNDEYDFVLLEDVFDRITRKNKDLETDIPLTISSLDGLVDQRTYFNKPIASKDMSGYYLLKNGEFAYNKSYSKGFPVGSIKRLDNYEMGALSTLYICFGIKKGLKVSSDYLKHFFESGCWYESVNYVCSEGARNHGLLNVSPYDFFTTGHYLAPTYNEQVKIANFFNVFDDLIANQRKKVEVLKLRREGIVTNIFKCNFRFKDDKGTPYSDWEETFLNEVLTERKDKNSGKEEVYSVSVSKGLINQLEHLGKCYAAEDTSKYKLVKNGDVVYTKSPTGDFKWGIVKQSKVNENVIVSPLYGVFVPSYPELGALIDLYFSSEIRAHNYLITQVRKGAKNTINVTNDEFLNNSIFLPSDKNETKKIITFVNLLDEEITNEGTKLDSLILKKRGLMQLMFI